MSESSPVLPGTVADDLRARIIAQDEAPGTAITESAVALRYGVARSTARTAIDRLVAEGLLVRSAHRAARVPELSRADIADLFDSRAVVEAAAVASVATSGTLSADALAAHRALLATPAGEPFAETDIAFHRALVTGQPSARLARMHSALMGEIELCIGQVQAHSLLTAAEVAHQHQGILDAVVAGDAERAADLTREHIASSRERLLAHYDATH